MRTMDELSYWIKVYAAHAISPLQNIYKVYYKQFYKNQVQRQLFFIQDGSLDYIANV